MTSEEAFNNVMKKVWEHSTLERDITHPCVILTKKAWEILRKADRCYPFTDEALDNAVKGDGIIGEGWVEYCGTVLMVIDPPCPVLPRDLERSVTSHNK